MSHDVSTNVGASAIDPKTSAIWVQCKGVALSEDQNDAEDFGQVMFACALGVSAMPYPADANGSAELIIARDVPGLSGVAVAARDLRSGKIVGNLKQGDTVMHSTGPQQASQVQCKEDTRQTVLVTIDSHGKHMICVLDGTSDKIQLSAFGQIIQMTRDEGILLSTGAASIEITKTGQIIIAGQVVLGGRTPIAPLAACVPPNVPPGPATAGIPVPGVFWGA